MLTNAMELPLKLNKRPVALGNYVSLLALFAPGMLFGLGLVMLRSSEQRFQWLTEPKLYPLELWIIIVSGTIATLGGIGDWIFHRVYVSSGPKESKSHLLALATGGIPLFALMALASISNNPLNYLIPTIIALLYTTTLICYDEFVFHLKRCGALETSFHRLLVFGNGIAFLAWAHWCFVSRTIP